jgi:hypothetical protein
MSTLAPITLCLPTHGIMPHGIAPNENGGAV